MKFTKYFMPLAALALLASCSNDNILDPNPGVENQAPEEGYNAKFTVALPSVGGTRAIEDENDFENGDEKEYRVRNAVIYIFEDQDYEESFAYEPNEDAFVCVAKSQIFYTDDKTANEKTDITQQVNINVRLNNVDKTASNYYALCIVNIDDSNGGQPGNNFTLPTVAVEADDSKDVAAVTGSTFGAWKKSVMQHDEGLTDQNKNPFMATINGETFFTMTNAPTYDSWEGFAGPKFTTLVPVDASAFVESPRIPTETAATFYVQRGVAKVVLQIKSGVKNGETDATLESIPSQYRTGETFQVKYWNVDVTNVKTYPVQVVDNVYSEYENVLTEKGVFDANWFYTSENETAGIKFNHIWWGEDPNYASVSNVEEDFYYLHRDDSDDYSDIEWKGIVANNGKNTAYCLENLMPYNQMIQNRTTRIVVKGQYKVNGQNGTDYSFVVNPNTDEAYPINSELLSASASSSGKSLASLFSDPLSPTSKAEIEKIASALHMNPTGIDLVDYYKDGETYYVARIHHFNPVDEVELGNVTDFSADNYGEPLEIKTVADYTAAHTGRYSILRNNAYYVSVEAVQGFGSPTIPEPDDTPDDDPDSKKYNLKCEINVLKWAIRDYGYILK